MMLPAVLTLTTMMAFAANSLLCRVALGGHLIDPVSFTTLRLAGGAAILVPLARLSVHPKAEKTGGSWISGAALFVYAAAFSLAYLSLDTGTGALILFGSVQATMLGAGLWSGERPRPLQWAGILVALFGLVYLVFPGISAPDPTGAALMSISGISWGLYSLRGRGSASPLSATAGNFLRTVPLAALAALSAISVLHAAGAGALLALISGAVTSGLGYVLWYRALQGLTATRAAVVQLTVPVLAALGGIVVLAETLSARMLIAGLLILGGVAAALLTHRSGQGTGTEAYTVEGVGR